MNITRITTAALATVVLVGVPRLTQKVHPVLAEQLSKAAPGDEVRLSTRALTETWRQAWSLTPGTSSSRSPVAVVAPSEEFPPLEPPPVVAAPPAPTEMLRVDRKSVV